MNKRILASTEYGQVELLPLSQDECKMLYDYFKNTFVTYEKPELLNLLREIREFGLNESNGKENSNS